MAVTGVLAVFLVLACAALFWVIKNYKSSVIRSYQLNELDISDPIASELKSLALKLAAIQDEADDCDGMTKKHVEHTVKIKKDIIRLGRELKNNERHYRVSLSSCEQKT